MLVPVLMYPLGSTPFGPDVRSPVSIGELLLYPLDLTCCKGDRYGFGTDCIGLR